jgi:F-type H+-transporting ATPase subunit delta
MKSNVKAARRYAKAILDLAVEQGGGASVRADLDAIHALLGAKDEMGIMCGDYTLPRSARRRILEAVFGGRVHALTWRLIEFLEGRRRLGLLASICRAYGELDDRARKRIKASLTGAFLLEPREAALVAQRIEGRTGCAVELSATVDESLLGGFRLLVGDQLYDVSLAGALDAFRRRAAGAGS